MCEGCKLKRCHDAKRCAIAKAYYCSESWVNKVSKMTDKQVVAIFLKFYQDKKAV